jgi:hypothetical protein
MYINLLKGDFLKIAMLQGEIKRKEEKLIEKSRYDLRIEYDDLYKLKLENAENKKKEVLHDFKVFVDSQEKDTSRFVKQITDYFPYHIGVSENPNYKDFLKQKDFMYRNLYLSTTAVNANDKFYQIVGENETINTPNGNKLKGKDFKTIIKNKPTSTIFNKKPFLKLSNNNNDVKLFSGRDVNKQGAGLYLHRVKKTIDEPLKINTSILFNRLEDARKTIDFHKRIVPTKPLPLLKLINPPKHFRPLPVPKLLKVVNPPRYRHDDLFEIEPIKMN